MFLSASVVLASFVTFINKIIAESAHNIWLAVALTYSSVAVFSLLLFVYQKRSEFQTLIPYIKLHSTRSFIWFSITLGLLQALAFGFLMPAFRDGPVSIVYTINSLYIVIPIMLSIIYYHEHWSVRKVTALVLSIAALALLK